MEPLETVLRNGIPRWQEEAAVPGVSVALLKSGQTTPLTFGTASRETGQPVTPETVFEAASLTKPVFAYAVLKLCEHGLLGLDAPLSGYLPWPYITGEPLLERITVRHVLAHTGGFPNWRPKRGQPDEEPLRIEFTPGERFSYSGEGYWYLQRVVEHLTEERLADFLATRLLAPLGMANSSFIWRENFETAAAQGHDDEGKAVPLRRPDEANAAYSLMTTPADFARLVQAVLDPPAPDETFLRPETVREMLTPQVPLVDARLAWGLGWGLVADGPASFWHWGDNGPFHCFVAACPATRRGIVVMTNSRNGARVYRRVATAVMGEGYPPLDWLNASYKRW